MSESINCIIDLAKYGTWLCTADNIWDKTSDRITEKYAAANQLEVTVTEVTTIIQSFCNACIGFLVGELTPDEKLFKVARSRANRNETDTMHILDASKMMCSCGKWQDKQYLCVDACA